MTVKAATGLGETQMDSEWVAVLPPSVTVSVTITQPDEGSVRLGDVAEEGVTVPAVAVHAKDAPPEVPVLALVRAITPPGHPTLLLGVKLAIGCAIAIETAATISSSTFRHLFLTRPCI